ncbi:hypothetical protein FVA74_10330 [Salinibacterium sp. dk2585]|uniref:DUF6264 family protein n=1 Tax=unclassified Salinibacterium TaxID=2632331 RepID=UPI0011C247FB|nr:MULTISPECIES: DUF6264 family protein [unclassified Salinibacterium]QEE61920.1 hypothetical protein FVA74_10330 [Salinibacterium sp. dk2585]TXK54525.1 hypothetical protein FVP63_05630 [Salinibacterium sp. dk5596]
MTAAADRPRPEYGEYATPEQVAKARGMTLEEYERHLASLTRPRVEEQATDATAPAATAPAVERPAAPAPAASDKGAGNRMATTMLLVFGLACTLLSIPSLLGLGDGLATAFGAQGLDAYTSFTAARAFGIIAIIAQLLLWVLTLWLSVAAVRRGRASWWIPLVAGVLAVLLVSALWLAAIIVDPAFMRYVESVSLQA